MTVKMLYNVGVDYIAVIYHGKIVKTSTKTKKKCAPLRRKKPYFSTEFQLHFS